MYDDTRGFFYEESRRLLLTLSVADRSLHAVLCTSEISHASSCRRLIASRYPVGIGGLFYPSTLQHLHQHQQQQHQHHSRLAAAASSALSNAVQVAGQSPDIVDADGIRGVLLGGAGWPFPWRPTHSLQTLEHPSQSDVVGTLSRVSPASASFPQRGKFKILLIHPCTSECCEFKTLAGSDGVP